MPAPAADCAMDPAAPVGASLTSGNGGPKINPLTGLSTDYLNHFTEAVMVLEMVGAMPECLEDLLAWKPKTYVEHFNASRFTNRDAIVAAYHVADPSMRAALDCTAELLNAMVQRTSEVIRRHAGTADVGTISRRALDQIQPQLARITAVINGTTHQAIGQPGSQAAIDAMFGR